MDFGKILENWEKSQTPDSLKKSLKEKNYSQDNTRHNISSKSLPINATIDLHGMTSQEAETTLDCFFRKAKRLGYKKVLIIHGKGIHTKGEPILKDTVEKFIAKCTITGAHGHPSASDGGSGATWVIIR